MFKDIQNLLEFIENAKKANIKSFQIGDIKVEFSDFAFVENIANVPKSEERSTSKTMVDTLSGEEDEELLFWSSNKA